jgi:hypothetical protein
VLLTYHKDQDVPNSAKKLQEKTQHQMVFELSTPEKLVILRREPLLNRKFI